MPEHPGNAAPHELLVCVNLRRTGAWPSCGGRGAEALARALEAGVAARKIPVRVVRIRCFGRCDEGPNLRLAPGGAFRRGVGPAQVPAILDWLDSAVPRDGA